MAGRLGARQHLHAIYMCSPGPSPRPFPPFPPLFAGEGKMFAPGNLRATFDNAAYERLINFYLGEKYTLRYTGGMVPDVFQVGGRLCAALAT